MKPYYFLLFILFILPGCNYNKMSPIEELKQAGHDMRQYDNIEYSYLIKTYFSYVGDTIALKGRMYFETNMEDSALHMNFYHKSNDGDNFYNGKYLISLHKTDSFAMKKPLCDYEGGHMTAYPFLEFSFGAIKLFLNDTNFYSGIDSLQRKSIEYKGKGYSSFSFWINKEIINTYKVGVKGKAKVKLIIRKSDNLPVFYSQYQVLKRKDHNDIFYVESKFSKYSFDKDYPDSVFSIESVPDYYSWDKYKMFKRTLPAQSIAPEWELPSLNDDTISLSDFKGKYVLLDFWFIGCGACIQSIPVLNKIYADYKNKEVVVLGINCFNDHKEKISKYCDELGMKYPNLWKGENITDKYSVKAAPVFYLIDPNGTIIYSQVGHNSKKLLNALKKFVK